MRLSKSDGSLSLIKQIGEVTTSDLSYDASDRGHRKGIGLNDSHVFCSGYTKGDFGEPNAGDSDVFVLKLSKSNGELVWDKADWRNLNLKCPYNPGEKERCLSMAVQEKLNFLWRLYRG